jgi:DNA-binding SARP family transcriptional activator
LHLVAFGSPVLTRDGGPVPPELAWRKHFALLVYLARSPGGTRRREHLVGLLWPDKDEAKARHSLNEACRAIRRGAGDDALATQADAIALSADCLTTDWRAAEAALEAGNPLKVAELWRGDFMEGFGIPDASPFEDWLAAERLHWRARFRDALTAEAERLVREGDVVRGLALAARVLVFDPAAEAALRVAMTAEALAGAAPAALERFAGYAGWLARELGAEPAADLAQLATRIRTGARAGRAAVSGDEPPPPPLVGRGHALAAAARYLPRPGSGASVILVMGEPGLGRSRLVREIAMRAGLAGAVVTTTVCVAADADVPGTVLGDLLRRGLVDAAGFGGAPGEALTALAALEPGVAARYPGVAATARALTTLGRAFGEAAAAVAEEAPLLIAIDDAHLADDATLEALPGLLRAAARAPVTLLLSARTGPDMPAALSELRSRIGHDVAGVELAADPLDDRSVEALVAALLPGYDAEQRERLVRRLRQETAGVPLFAVEILRALAASGATAGVWPAAGETTAQPLPFKVPGAVTAALTLRVAALDADARDTLLGAAVAGERVDETVLAHVVAAAPADLERRLGVLERAGFLVHDGARYRFGADMVRSFLASLMLTGAERKRLHEKVAAALASSGQRDSLAYAEHLYGSGSWAEAAERAGLLAESARRSGHDRLATRAGRLRARAAERASTG